MRQPLVVKLFQASSLGTAIPRKPPGLPMRYCCRERPLPTEAFAKVGRS